MLMEPEIFALYEKKENFHHSYFAYLDEYDTLAEHYLFLYTALEETLDMASLNILGEMLECQKKIEEFQAMHYFRQGALLEKEFQKQAKTY